MTSTAAATGTIIPLVEGTLDAFIMEYLRGRVSRAEITATTAATLSYTLAGFSASFGRRPLTQLGPRAVDRWLETIGGHAPATRREYLSRLRGLVGWLIDTGTLADDPTAHVGPISQPRQVPVTLTDRQVAALLSVCPDVRARAVVWLMVGCGCRCIELERLRVEDYDPSERTITLRGKGLHERTIPVPTPTAAALDTYLDGVGRVAGPMFAGQRGAMRSATFGVYVRRWLRTAGVKTANLDGRSAHALRRTAGSDVMARSGDVRVVQAMLGHSRIETTARHYLRPVSIDSLRAAMEGRDYGDAA